jgi:hypothetical protein
MATVKPVGPVRRRACEPPSAIKGGDEVAGVLGGDGDAVQGEHLCRSLEVLLAGHIGCRTPAATRRWVLKGTLRVALTRPKAEPGTALLKGGNEEGDPQGAPGPA